MLGGGREGIVTASEGSVRMSAETHPTPQAVLRMRTHPELPAATRRMLRALIEAYGSNSVWNRVFSDRGRFMGSLAALYLHLCPDGGTGQQGLTLGRLQALCMDIGLCSRGRARALLILLQVTGYIAADPGSAADRRQRRFVPTQRLTEFQHRRWSQQFAAMDALVPHARAAQAACGRPDFAAAFLAEMARCYRGGFRLLHYAPELAQLTERNAGLLLASSLILAAPDELPEDGAAVPVSISALAARFGIARAHARGLLEHLAEAGLIRRAPGHDSVLVLPDLARSLLGFYAACFALLAHGAAVALREIDAEAGLVP
jgi:hypothetical protein